MFCAATQNCNRKNKRNRPVLITDKYTSLHDKPLHHLMYFRVYLIVVFLSNRLTGTIKHHEHSLKFERNFASSLLKTIHFQNLLTTYFVKPTL